MPSMQAMVERLNVRFNRDNIREIEQTLLAPQANLVESAQKAGIAVSDAEIAYLSSWPAGLQEAIRAALASARARLLPVQFVWAPGYQYEVNFWEVAGTERSLGGMTVVFRSPLPTG